jgi:hypothetical protein
MKNVPDEIMIAASNKVFDLIKSIHDVYFNVIEKEDKNIDAKVINLLKNATTIMQEPKAGKRYNDLVFLLERQYQHNMDLICRNRLGSYLPASTYVNQVNKKEKLHYDRLIGLTLGDIYRQIDNRTLPAPGTNLNTNPKWHYMHKQPSAEKILLPNDATLKRQYSNLHLAWEPAVSEVKKSYGKK